MRFLAAVWSTGVSKPYVDISRLSLVLLSSTDWRVSRWCKYAHTESWSEKCGCPIMLPVDFELANFESTHLSLMYFITSVTLARFSSLCSKIRRNARNKRGENFLKLSGILVVLRSWYFLKAPYCESWDQSALRHGELPVNKVNIMMPNCQESLEKRQMNFSFFTASITSGGKKFFHVCLMRLTRMPPRVVCPKSHSLMRVKSKVNTKTFSNFKSRWTRFFECMKPSDELNCVAIIFTADSLRPPGPKLPARSPVKRTDENKSHND